MKKNLNDETRRMMKYEEPLVEKKQGWVLTAALLALVLMLGYYLFT